MENFKVGDRVVCVDNSDWRGAGEQPKLVLNREYIVYGIKKCGGCGCQDLDVGLSTDGNWENCKCGIREKKTDNIHWCGSFRFRKVAEKVEYIAVAVDVEIEEPNLN
jgi:reverse gyrase